MQFRDNHDKTRYVNRMFGRIASRYDWGNRVLSLGRDQSWRRRAVDMLDPTPDHRVLDVGAGTGDLSLYLARRAGAVVALDFSRRMMGIGAGKAATSGVQDRVCFVAADALRLPFADDSFDGTAVAFTIRNFASIDDGLAEIHRVLRPGGRLVCLEFTRPPSSLLNWLYQPYLKYLVPLIGGGISGDRDAYRYLAASINAFPMAEDLAGAMRDAGFRKVEWRYLNMATVAIHVTHKDASPVPQPQAGVPS